MEQGNSAPETIKQRKGRGERRPGAGRKPDYLKRLGITPMKAAEILAHHDEPKLWSGLLNSKSEDVRFRTLSYLTDRRDGKPKQQVDVSGGLMHGPHNQKESNTPIEAIESVEVAMEQIESL